MLITNKWTPQKGSRGYKLKRKGNQQQKVKGGGVRHACMYHVWNRIHKWPRFLTRLGEKRGNNILSGYHYGFRQMWKSYFSFWVAPDSFDFLLVMHGWHLITVTF